MKSIKEIQNFEGKKVLVRVDWNVPVDTENRPTDFSRVEVSTPTIEYIKNHNGIPIIASHFGREGESMVSIINLAKERFEILKSGVEFLENLRIDKREEENDESFAKEISEKASFYINDAFSVSHREHSSIVGVPKFLPSFAGLRFMEEYQNLSKVFSPPKPFLVIFGGMKAETKVPLIEKFIDVADTIFVGGLLASKVAPMEIARNPKIILPTGDLMAPDIDVESLEILKNKIQESKFVLWNGPLGNYEKGFDFGTKELARIINTSGVEAIIGGGDTENVIDTEIDKTNKKVFISLAGGAMLDFFADHTLPGIKVLSKVFL